MVLMHADDAAPPRGGGGNARAGSSRAPAGTSRPHGKGNAEPRKPAAKRTADPAAGGKPAAKKRRPAALEAPTRQAIPTMMG